MDAKIQELTSKIYREGVEKGNEEANRIISEAKANEQKMIQDAKTEADRIITAAEKQVADLKKNTEAELKLFANQAVEALKSEITNLITGKIANTNIKAVTSDKTFMQQFILDMAKEWAKNGAITIQTAKAEELSKYFTANAKDLLEKDVKIEKVNGRDTSFTIMPADGSYKVVFGEEELVAFFKEFLRPQLIEMLF